MAFYDQLTWQNIPNYLNRLSQLAMDTRTMIRDWLPKGKEAAVCFSIDDVHPGTSQTGYDAGGDREAGVLGRVTTLLKRHPKLHATLLVTPNWQPRGLVGRRWPIHTLPWIRDRVFAPTRHARNAMHLQRHPAFVKYLKELKQVSIAAHGYTHLRKGSDFAPEFLGCSEQNCRNLIEKSLTIFAQVGLETDSGCQPPAWHLPQPLIDTLAQSSLRWVSSSRDLLTPITPDARTNMSGLHNVALVQPQWLVENRLVHMSTNFQATSPVDRAFEIVECGGMLSIKAHIFKEGGGHTMKDGLDELYINYLDTLFTQLDERYGDALWWTSFEEISNRCYTH